MGPIRKTLVSGIAALSMLAGATAPAMSSVRADADASKVNVQESIIANELPSIAEVYDFRAADSKASKLSEMGFSISEDLFGRKMVADAQGDLHYLRVAGAPANSMNYPSDAPGMNHQDFLDNFASPNSTISIDPGVQELGATVAFDMQPLHYIGADATSVGGHNSVDKHLLIFERPSGVPIATHNTITDLLFDAQYLPGGLGSADGIILQDDTKLTIDNGDGVNFDGSGIIAADNSELIIMNSEWSNYHAAIVGDNNSTLSVIDNVFNKDGTSSSPALASRIVPLSEKGWSMDGFDYLSFNPQLDPESILLSSQANYFASGNTFGEESSSAPGIYGVASISTTKHVKENSGASITIIDDLVNVSGNVGCFTIDNLDGDGNGVNTVDCAVTGVPDDLYLGTPALSLASASKTGLEILLSNPSNSPRIYDLDLFDVRGRLLEDLSDDFSVAPQSQGAYTTSGLDLPSGIHFLRAKDVTPGKSTGAYDVVKVPVTR